MNGERIFTSEMIQENQKGEMVGGQNEKELFEKMNNLCLKAIDKNKQFD